MRILKIVLITAAIVLGLIVIIGLFLPSELEVEESIEINTPANVIYSQVAKLENRQQWDPWLKLDTGVVVNYTGSLAGEGAVMEWSSKNEDVGTGSLTIKEAKPYEYMKMNLKFMDQGSADVEWFFDQNNESTEVKWKMMLDADIPILGGYLVMIMAPRLSDQFQKGLENLKEVAENMENKMDYSDVNLRISSVESQKVLCVSGETSQNIDEIKRAFEKIYTQLFTNIEVNKIEITGPALSISKKWEENQYEFDACIPISEVKGDLSTGVFETSTYSGPVVKAQHIGSYEELEKTWSATQSYIEQFKLEIVGNPWEEYVSDPTETPEDKLITNLYFPVK